MGPDAGLRGAGATGVQTAITLVGTGHVFDIGARVRQEIRWRAPQVVAVELDPPRYHALRNKDQPRGKAPFVYRTLAGFQKRLANEYGVEAGGEMLAAADEAHALGIPLALIDKDAQQTFQRLLREMKFSEKAKLAGSAIAGLFLPGKSIEKQVDEMQEDYASFFVEMGHRFPTLKRVLLDERNEHMARALVEMSKTQERIVAARSASEGEDDSRPQVRIVAVMGDGHVDGVRDILAARGIAVETVRLKELRARPVEATGTASATVSFSVDADAPPRS